MLYFKFYKSDSPKAAAGIRTHGEVVFSKLIFARVHKINFAHDLRRHRMNERDNSLSIHQKNPSKRRIKSHSLFFIFLNFQSSKNKEYC